MNPDYDAIIMGGGAAGLMTAWQAGLRGRRVVVLERSKQPGRKILMSGGGRCNFTNLHITPDHFICENPHFVKSALKQYSAYDFIASVESHGVAYHERKHGQLFCDNKARDIVNMLSSECDDAGVKVITRCEIHSIDKNRHGFVVKSNLGEFRSQSVVVATGGLSIPHMDPTPFGYQVARQFGMRVLPTRASLVPYTFSGEWKAMFARLAGTAIDVVVSCGATSFEEAMLFTHRGLSGPAILQVSNYWHESEAIVIDLLPGEDAAGIMRETKIRQPKSLARTILGTRLPRSVVAEFEQLWWQEQAGRPLAHWRDDALVEVFSSFNRWQVVPAGTEGYRTAEVTAGGVDTDELSSRTMESRSCPGLFFVGEVVDVTGHLGGFNFQWAWSSGYACAQAL